MSRTHYPDGTRKVPQLGAMCTEPNANHGLCGGWWCICSCHDSWDIGHSFIRPHVTHPWKQVGRCTYCAACDVRLYHGQVVADDQREGLAASIDSLHDEIAEGWRDMRRQVLAAREVTR